MTEDGYKALVDYVERVVAEDSYETGGGYYHAWGVVHIADDKLVEGWPDQPDVEHTYLAGTYLEHDSYHGNHSVQTLMQWVVNEDERRYEGGKAEEDLYAEPLLSAVKEVCALAASSPFSPFQ